VVDKVRASLGGGPAPANLIRNLFFGLSGDDVKQLQQFLKDKGYYTYPEITGYFGQITKEAVMVFQKANGIEPLGGVGPQTRAAIEKAE
jgi:peptidoglycan hydrolase-like protein with peptidoglycan-binding domain